MLSVLYIYHLTAKAKYDPLVQLFTYKVRITVFVFYVVITFLKYTIPCEYIIHFFLLFKVENVEVEDRRRKRKR